MSAKTDEIIFDGRSASPAAMADAIRSRGCVLIKQALEPNLVDYCARAMEKNSQHLNAMLGKEVNFLPLCFTDRYFVDQAALPSYHSSGLEKFTDPLTYSRMDRSWYYEGKRQFKEWFWQHGAEFPNILLRGVVDSVLHKVFRIYFGEPCISPYEHDALHYQRADIEHLSYFFHQDGSYFTREPKEHNGLTAWIPLNDCGRHSPGLEVHPFKTTEVIGPPKGATLPNMFADADEVLERYGDRLWAPEFEVGDCLLFDNFTIHRTHITPGMTKQRQSAELRLFPASHVPAYTRLHGGWMVEI